MPGRRLNDNERRLTDFWSNPPANFHRPLLRQLRIEGGSGLRGIGSLVMPFPYPLTVVCGRNGVGKSTVLGLAALSATPPADWRVYWGNTRPRKNPNARAQYKFNDFFHRPQGASSLDGLRLTWIFMDQGNEIEVTKRMESGRWVNVGNSGRSRTTTTGRFREIDFIPMARVLPAIEFGAVRSAFDGNATPAVESLTPDFVAKLSYIMGRQYSRAETRYVRGLGLANCAANATYTGFDMGSGESSVIAMLSRLQSLPDGGLAVIEEVELGLHAEAQERLMEMLLDLCYRKKLQIICTTHSEVVIDAVPRSARVLLRRTGQEHEALSNVSTRFAVHEMVGRTQPELVIYTEDTLAGIIVEECISGTLRSRISIRDVGSNATLARQAVAHLRLNPELKALSVFDGDCAEAQINNWLRQERGERDIHPVWQTLPGDLLAPERWLVRELAHSAYRDVLCSELNCATSIADAHIEAMRVQLDHHDCGYVLGSRTGLGQDVARRMVVRSVARAHPGLESLRRQIRQLLDG